MLVLVVSCYVSCVRGVKEALINIRRGGFIRASLAAGMNSSQLPYPCQSHGPCHAGRLMKSAAKQSDSPAASLPDERCACKSVVCFVGSTRQSWFGAEPGCMRHCPVERSACAARRQLKGGGLHDPIHASTAHRW